jgi:hypothetical protein
VRYELGTGEIDIDLVDAKDESVYRENAEVSSFAELVLANLARQKLDPLLSDEARGLGFAGVDQLESRGNAGPEAAEKTPWLDVEDPVVGHVLVYNDAADELSVVADEREIRVASESGIRVVLADLGVSARFSLIRYDVASGDLEVRGLGQLENTILRQCVERLLRGPVARQAAEGAPIQEFLDEQEQDDKGRYVIRADSAVVYVPKDPILDVRITSDLLLISFEPPIFVDGKGPGNFKVKEVGYSFKEGGALVDLSGTNILAALFKGTGKSKVKEAILELVQAKLPAAMLEPGYKLLSDPNRSEHIAQLLANFSSDP